MSSTVDAKKLQADESTNKKTDNNKYFLIFDTHYILTRTLNNHKNSLSFCLNLIDIRANVTIYMYSGKSGYRLGFLFCSLYKDV